MHDNHPDMPSIWHASIGQTTKGMTCQQHDMHQLSKEKIHGNMKDDKNLIKTFPSIYVFHTEMINAFNSRQVNVIIKFLNITMGFLRNCNF